MAVPGPDYAGKNTTEEFELMPTDSSMRKIIDNNWRKAKQVAFFRTTIDAANTERLERKRATH